MMNRYASFMLTMVQRFWLILALLWMPFGQAAPLMQASLPDIAVAELPNEARDTLRAIKKGGPFAYPRDGVVFNNYERILPKRSRGYYREYTVKTPGAHNRGGRRIISGEASEYYYTADHYQTFKRIRE